MRPPAPRAQAAPARDPADGPILRSCRCRGATGHPPCPRQTRPVRAAVLRFHTGFPGRRIRHAFRHPGARTPVPETCAFDPPHGVVTNACRNLAWRNVRAAAVLPPRGTAATRSWQRPVSWASHVVAGRRGGPFGLSPFMRLSGHGSFVRGLPTRRARCGSHPYVRAAAYRRLRHLPFMKNRSSSAENKSPHSQHRPKRNWLGRWVSAVRQADGTARSGAGASTPGCVPRLRPMRLPPRCCRCARG